MDPHLNSNNYIIFGRGLAVLLFLFLGIQAVAKLLGDSWQNLQLLCCQRHHLVCGLGRIGWQLVQELLKQNKQVVVIERDPANPLCSEARRLGTIVIIGNAIDDEMLEHAQLKKADTVYIVTGSDETNIEAAVEVQATVHEEVVPETPPTAPRCFVHVLEPALRNKVRIDKNKTLPVTPFNVMHNTVRNLIVRHLTPVRPRTPEQVALYIIVGFGMMGQALAAHLAELAHFENRKRARLLILTEDRPAAAAKAFLSRWGQFSPCLVARAWDQIKFDARWDEWSCRTKRPGPAYQVEDERAIEYACNAIFAPCPKFIAERGFLNALTQQLMPQEVVPAILVCMDREHESYGAAITLQQSLRPILGDKKKAPVFVWLPKQEPLKQLLTPAAGEVIPFGSCQDELRLQNVIDPVEEKLAKAIMADFHNLDRHKDRAKIDERWRTDPELFRQSNRSAATHALIAMSYLGVEMVPPGETTTRPPAHLSADNAQKATLAEMEHNRWVAERLLAGFSYGETSSNAHPPRRPQLCTWEVLNNDPALRKEPAKDFKQIELVLATLQRLGYTAVEAESK